MLPCWLRSVVVMNASGSGSDDNAKDAELRKCGEINGV